MSVFEYAARNAGEIALRTVQHLGLVGAATLVGVAIGVPLGIVITRRPRARVVVLGIANVLQTVPSLALFGFLLPLPLLGGVGAGTAIVALVVYALLPIVRNTFVGITTIDPAVRDAAVGMGMTDRQILRLVELPLAMPVILAGVRTATVIGVGIATIAAAIGAGGLGDFIFRGLAMVDNAVILAGAVPAAALALTLDGALHMIERRVDWRRRTAESDRAAL
jgi:osmoprotectant transport system permease protein